MSVYKDEKKSTWYCKFRYIDWQGNKKETTRRGFRTKKEAIKYEQDFIKQQAESLDMTLSALIEKYLEHQKKRTKASTYRVIVGIVNKHILPIIGQIKVTDITPNTIREWQLKLDDCNLSPATVKTINSWLSAILNFAVKYYNLPRNPLTVAGSTGNTKKRIEILEQDDFEKLCGNIPDEVFLLSVKLLYYSGMRVGELFALTVSDFDFTNNTININKTMSATEKKATTPKTKLSYRKIAIPQTIMQNVQQLFTRYIEIPSEPFYLCRLSNYSKRLKHYAKKAGISHIHPHMLRHSHASYLIQHGVPITSIAKRLGHSPDITLKVYSHCYRNSEKEIAELLNQEICGQNVVKRPQKEENTHD